ncbi:MAG: zf-HC2 domain-containing protein [Christensenellaceae bacterium]|jgi:hypothetical protein|nr:zf-HC2 domain-containing protein [Christensenellaceae bacterium]
MSQPCGVIRDLLPLYYDKVCSDESRALVEEHLQTCAACGAELKTIEAEFQKPRSFKSAEQATLDSLKRFKAKMLRKNVIVGAVSVLCAAAVLIGLFAYAFSYEKVVPYQEGLVTVEVGTSGVIDVYCNLGREAGLRVIDKTITQEGTARHAVYLVYTDTYWARHFGKIADPSQTKFTLGQTVTVITKHGTAEAQDNGMGSFGIHDVGFGILDISAVYYLEGNFRELSFNEAAFERAAPNAILLWEKAA